MFWGAGGAWRPVFVAVITSDASHQTDKKSELKWFSVGAHEQREAAMAANQSHRHRALAVLVRSYRTMGFALPRQRKHTTIPASHGW